VARTRRGTVALFLTAAAVYLADRVTKMWAASRLADDGPIDVIEGVLTLRFASNPGGAFSLGTSAPWFFAAATIVVSGLIVVKAFRPRATVQAVSLGAILGGALGNLTDRITRGPGFTGEVVDFIDLHVWPVFNLADSAIVVGAVALATWSLASTRGSDGAATGGPAPATDGR